jgi:hypothetical protein
MTTNEFVAKVNEMTAEVKALFPDGYTAFDGTTYAAGIQERADSIITYVTTEKAANLPASLNRFTADCDSYRKIAQKAEKKGWPKRG